MEKEIIIKKEEKVSIPLLVANLTLVCFVISLGFMIYNTKRHVTVDHVVEKPPINRSAFDNITLNAHSVFVWDIAKHESIFALNEDNVRPLASLTKIMTAVTALSILPKNTTVIVKKEFLAQEGDSGLYVDEKWNLKKLLDFSLVVSSNDGARSIAAVAGAFASTTDNYAIGLKTFITLMNKTAKEIGLHSLRFNNETGLDRSVVESGGYGNAKDMAKLMEYAMKTYPNILEATKDSSETIFSLDKKHSAVNTNEALSKIPSIVASKTGYTTLSGGNLAVVFDAGIARPVVIVVLGSTYNGRFSDVVTLASSTLTYLRDNEI